MIGSIICQHRLLVLILWLVAAAVLAAVIGVPDATVGETSDLLPADTPVHVALEAMTRHFGDKSALSEAVIVFERKDGPLTPRDFQDIEQLAGNLAHPLPGEAVDDEIRQIGVRTPASLALAGGGNPLLSEDRRAALVVVNLPYNFITKHAARFVKHAQTVVDGARFSPGLAAAVTGSAGYGYDYAVATENSHRKTILVTLVSVICILLLVYRAPVAALIPLAGISVAAVVVLN